MDKLPIIAFMTAWNEAGFIESAIRSTIDHVDEMIVIEGAFKETVETGGSLRSTDGTLDILEKLEREFVSKLYVYKSQFPESQLSQRSLFFQLMKQYLSLVCKRNYWMIIQDSDEIYDEENFNKLKNILNTTQSDVIKIDSLTFVNDFESYVKIAFPRCFRMRRNCDYTFCGANHLAYKQRGASQWCSLGPEENHEDEVKFFHMSYVKSPERFLQKKKEREKVHGINSFKWNLNSDNQVFCPGTNIRKFAGQLPELLKNHPLSEK
jgi:hypothetical protein